MAKYRIAGLKVEMTTFGRTLAQAIPYLADFDGAADVTIDSKAAPLPLGGKMSRDNQEYMDTGRSFYFQLLPHDGMMFHASCMLLEGKAYCFSGPCGTGKSTHTSLYRNHFGDDKVRILNDDKPALRRIDGTWFAFGTPWSGKTDLNLNLSAPLGGICFLEQGQANAIRRMAVAEAIPPLMQMTHHAKEPARIRLHLELLDSLLATVPVWRMTCRPDLEAVRLSYDAMIGRRL